MTAQTDRAQTLRRRRIGFYIAVVAGFLLVLSALFEAFPLAVVAWFGAESLEELYPDIAAIDSHRVHLLGLATLAWLLAVPIAVQLIRPATKIAAAVLALALVVILIPIDLATGFFDPLELVALTLFATIVWLHPGRREMSFTPMMRRSLTLAVVGALGWATFAVMELAVQLTADSANQHAAFGHHGIMAQVSLFIGVAAVVGASSLQGGRIVAVLAGAAAAYIGLASLVFPGYASSLGVPLGLLAIAWAGLYAWSALTDGEPLSTTADHRSRGPSASPPMPTGWPATRGDKHGSASDGPSSGEHRSPTRRGTA